MAKGKKKQKKGLTIFLIIAVSVLVVALGVSAYMILGTSSVNTIDRIVEYGTVAKGVSVGGIDISGMTEQEAREATKELESELIGATQLQFDVGDEIATLDAQTIGFTTDYEDVIAAAVGYGRTGSFEKRSEEMAVIKNGGKDFTVSITADEASVRATLETLGAPFNVEAKDASYTFMPDGYFEDGTPYTISPDSYGKAVEVKGLVRIPEEEKPNPLRYEFWNNTKFVDNYIPEGWDIARFKYEEEQRGTKTDTAALAALIMQAVQSGDLSSVITAPTEVTEPTVTLEQIKAQTQLVSSWTSSYSEHDGSSRVYNVAKMADIVGGTVLEPGVIWSINDTAGPRKKSTGWKEAAGINGGAFVPDPGGGVCQISSTLYNAIIRAGIEATDRSHHSIISDYIPIGLDATISTGGPDLKLRNNNSTPMFLVTYMNYAKKTVTVEVYGQPVVDPTYGEVILSFTSKKGSTGATPATSTIYNTAVAPDGTVIAPGASLEYRKARGSTQCTSYKHIYDLTGKKLHEEVFEKFTYRSYTGIIYVNGPDPATLPPVIPTPETPPAEGAPPTGVTP